MACTSFFVSRGASGDCSEHRLPLGALRPHRRPGRRGDPLRAAHLGARGLHLSLQRGDLPGRKPCADRALVGGGGVWLSRWPAAAPRNPAEALERLAGSDRAAVCERLSRQSLRPVQHGHRELKCSKFMRWLNREFMTKMLILCCSLNELGPQKFLPPSMRNFYIVETSHVYLSNPSFLTENLLGKLVPAIGSATL